MIDYTEDPAVPLPGSVLGRIDELTAEVHELSAKVDTLLAYVDNAKDALDGLSNNPALKMMLANFGITL